jgi:hypothetical protein
MIQYPAVLHEWMGWCPNAPGMRTVPTMPAIPPGTENPGEPGGRAGIPGRIGRGIGIAMRSTKILMQNRQLLWFSLLIGVVMAFVFIAQYGLRLLTVYPYDAIDFPRWIVLTFVVELITVLFLTMLLAGLILSLSEGESGRPASFREGLVRTRKYLHLLTDWSVILALLETGITILLFISGYSYFSLFPVLRQFPFSFILLPENYSIGPMGGTYALSSAITWTLTISGINAFVFIATLFVVPLVVLEKKTLPGAVTGSVSLMKKVLGEAMICFFLLILVISATAAASLLFPIVYGIVAPGRLLMYYPGVAWIAAAILFMLALYCLACVVSTIAGIAVTDLYRFGTSGRIAREPEKGGATAAELAG